MASTDKDHSSTKENVSDENSDNVDHQEEHMTRAAWLGCLALLLVQNAALQPIVISSITKQIDDKLGKLYSNQHELSLVYSPDISQQDQ